MAAPNLTLRNMCAVNFVGTDDAGYNAVGAPWSRLTIAAALADLAANYSAGTASNPHVVAIGPGVFTTPAFALPPHTFIQGEADSEGRPLTTIQLTGNVSLDSTWAAGAARGGFANLIFRSEGSDLNFTMPAPSSGNPARVLQLENVIFDLDTLTWQSAGTGDVLTIDRVTQDGNLTHVINLTGGTIKLNNLIAAATTTIASGASLAATVTATACSFAALVLAKGAAAMTNAFDAVSIPVIASFSATGGAVYTRLNDAYAEGYTPAVPGDWSPTPATVQAALDELAAAGAATGPNGYATATNNAGNTLISKTRHNYRVALTVGGAARTSVMILDVANSPLAGDVISIGCTLPATAAIVLEFRNATAAGTLIYTMTTDAATLSGRFQFVYTGTAWIADGYQIPYQT